jgi:hypothetical protein
MQPHLLAGWKPAQSNRDWRINERLRGLDLKMAACIVAHGRFSSGRLPFEQL